MVIAVACLLGFVIYKYSQKARSKSADDYKSKSTTAVKIDREGNYRYHRMPSPEKDSNRLDWKVILLIAELAHLYIPFNLYFNRG